MYTNHYDCFASTAVLVEAKCFSSLTSVVMQRIDPFVILIWRASLLVSFRFVSTSTVRNLFHDYYHNLLYNVGLFILNVVSSNTTAPTDDIIFIEIDTKKEIVLIISDWFIDFYLIFIYNFRSSCIQ